MYLRSVTGLICSTGNFVPINPSGVCVPRGMNMSLLSATFDPTLSFMALTFNFNVPLNYFPCNQLFDAATNALVGEDASCFAAGSDDPGVVYVYMSGAWTVAPNSTITISSKQTILTDPVFNMPFTGSAMVANGCGMSDYMGNQAGITASLDDCLAPEAVIVNSPTVYGPCPGSTVGVPFTFDGSLSFDYSGKPLTSYAWTYTGTDALSGAFTDQSSMSMVTVNGAIVASLTAGSYTVSLTVTNFLGKSSQASGSITVETGKYAPAFTIAGPPTQAFILGVDGLPIRVNIDETSLCAGYTTTWSWGFAQGSADTFDLTAVQSAVPLIMTPSDLSQAGAKVGKTYNLVLTGSLVDSSSVVSASATASVSVTFGATPLRVSLNGPAGWVADSSMVMLTPNAVDPDNQKGARFIYIWSCTRADGQACFADAQKKGTQYPNGTWVFAASALQIDMSHLFTVTVNTTDSTKRSASAFQSVISKRVNGMLPTGTLAHYCPGGPCRSKIDATQPVSIVLTMDKMFANATLAWSLPDYPSVPGFSGNFTSNAFSILPTNYPKGTTSFTVYCDITNCDASGACTTGRVVDRIDTGRPPYCSVAAGW